MSAAPARAIPDVPPTCTFENAVMDVDSGYWDTTVERRGDDLVPTYARGDVDCGPVQPTVFNTDTIKMNPEGDFNVAPGRFAPGLTPEADGSPEIELVFETGILGATIHFQLGPGDANVVADALDDRTMGINTNASATDTDAELIVPATKLKYLEYSSLDINGGSGDDRIDTSGGPGFAGPAQSGVLFVGGDSGDDHLIGGPGTDWLDPGRGADTVEAGRGKDVIATKDHSRDTVDCGAGRDILFRNHRDRARGCEYSYDKNDDPGDDPPPLPFAAP